MVKVHPIQVPFCFSKIPLCYAPLAYPWPNLQAASALLSVVVCQFVFPRILQVESPFIPTPVTPPFISYIYFQIIHTIYGS